MARDSLDEKLYPIGDFAKVTGFPVKTLRYYDQEGVLTPAYVDPLTGYRSYTESQRRAMHLLAEVHIMGVPVDMLRDFMREPTLEHQAVLYDWKIRQLEQDIREHQLHLRSLKRKRDHPWRQEHLDVLAERLPSRAWVCLHYVTTMAGLEERREEAFGTVRNFLERRGVAPASPPMSFGLPSTDLRAHLTGIEIYAGFEVEEEVPPDETVVSGHLPPGLWYGATHTGPYEHIWHVMTMLLERVQADGLRDQRGVGGFLTQEIFHVGPWDTAEVGHWRTTVRWLVRPDLPDGHAKKQPRRSGAR